MTDSHLDSHNLPLQKSIYSQVRDICVKYNVKKVLHGGDIFEARKAQPLEVLTGFSECLQLLELVDIHLTAIPGNHDKTDYNSKLSYLSEFKHHPNFTLIDEFGSNQINNNLSIHFLPYFDESKDKYIKYLRIIDECGFENKCNILITHIAVENALDNDNIKVSNFIKSNEFDKFDKVLIGHYHKRNQISDKIFYVGSTHNTQYDNENERGVTIIYSDGSHEYETLNTPKFFKIEVNVDRINNDFIKSLIKEKKESNDNYRLIIAGDSSKLKEFDSENLEIAGINVKKESTVIVEELDKAFNGEFTSFTKESLLVNFDEFCQKELIEDSEYGLQILKQI